MKLVFATNNQYKFQEINKTLENKITLLNLKDLDFHDEIPETHETIEENAREKALYIYNRFHLNCFADDTGLEVDALNGRPGVYSARYAGESCSFEDNMKKILHEMTGISNRKAKFRTVIALVEEGNIRYFEGIIHGKILESPIGHEGFGYDPVFQPEGYNKTFAEMTLHEKNKISHRAIAINKLIDYLNNKKQ